MKKLIIFATLLILYVPLMAQPEAIADFQSKYHNTGKYFDLRIEGGILKILSNVETDDSDTQDLIKLINGIDVIDVNSICKSEAGFGDKDYMSLLKEIRGENFEDLMVVSERDEKINFLVKENRGLINDLVMLVNHPEEFLVMNISGNIDLHTLAKLSQKVNFKGSEDLEKLKEE